MNISIKVVKREPEMWMDSPFCYGEITIGDYTEGFEIPVDYWEIEDYEKQWKEGLERIKTHNTSCLVTAIGDPKYGLGAFFWPLYKIGNRIYVRKCLYITESLEILIEEGELSPDLKNLEFNAETCYKFIVLRRTNLEIEDDYKESIIDEWSVSIDNWN